MHFLIITKIKQGKELRFDRKKWELALLYNSYRYRVYLVHHLFTEIFNLNSIMNQLACKTILGGNHLSLLPSYILSYIYISAVVNEVVSLYF